MGQENFVDTLTKKLVASRNNRYTDNYDIEQKGPLVPVPSPWIEVRRALTEWAQTFLNFLRFGKRFARTALKATKSAIIAPLARQIVPGIVSKTYANRFSEVSYLFDKLTNQASRDLLVDLFAYRILGFEKVKLARNNPEYWNGIKNLSSFKTSEAPMKIAFMDAQLPVFDLEKMGYNLKTHATSPGLACAFVQKQYEYHKDGIHIKAEAGDVAIDAGGCWGETTMYFAHEVGEQGEVYSFEFIPSNLQVMYKNIGLNPHLAKRVNLVEAPIWNESNKRLYYVDWGPGSNVNTQKLRDTYVECYTKSIDDLVTEKKIRSVDFIKMDIEGAELAALQGAEKSIRKFKPKLAISVYHQLEDFTTIPKFLDSLGLDFHYYLDHHTIHTGETVLFALPAARRQLKSDTKQPSFSQAAVQATT